MTKLKLFAVAVLSCVLCLAAQPAQAAVMTFSDRASFDAATGGGLSFESFEGSGFDAPTVSFTGFSMTETGGGNAVFRSGIGVTDGSFAAAYTDNGSSVLTFQFDSPINAFGFDIEILYLAQRSGITLQRGFADSADVGACYRISARATGCRTTWIRMG